MNKKNAIEKEQLKNYEDNNDSESKKDNNNILRQLISIELNLFYFIFLNYIFKVLR